MEVAVEWKCGEQRTAQQRGDGGQQRGDDDRTRRRRCAGRGGRQGSFFFLCFFRSEEEVKGVGLNLCLVSDVGDVIMRGQGEQVLPHYCNENDIPPLHQLEKVAIKVANKVPPGKTEKKTTL